MVLRKIKFCDSEDELAEAKNLYQWNKEVFGALGVWPLERNDFRFALSTIYLLTHLTSEFADLLSVFGNLELMILNLSETTLTFMIVVKVIVMRYSKVLKRLMHRIISSIDVKWFNDDEEVSIYLKYNKVAKTFFMVWGGMAITSAIIYYVKPLEFRLRAALGHENMPFVNSYRARVFFEVNDTTTFSLLCIFQFPMIYFHAFHAMSISYLYSIILHVCGQLAVLACRIRSLDSRLEDNPEKSRIIFRSIVKTHCSILSMARDIESAFNLLLLEELFISTVIVGLAAYSVLASTGLEDSGTFISFLIYGMTMLFLLNGYCVAGERLITESTKVYEAYFECRWYDLSISATKQLTICMIGATRPMQLTGGGYYIFSLAGFANVLKSIFGYISMLRTIV